MAHAIGALARTEDSPTPARSLRVAGVLRLALGWTILAGALLFFFGTSWDIQWHTYVGRDRTLIPPHLMMLAGVALSGVAALTAVLAETVALRATGPDAPPTTRFAGLFHGPLGAYLAGFAALTAAAAFPLDSYWHALYGIDVAIWAPFHVMFLMSMGLVALGALHVLASATHVSERAELARVARAGTLGAVMACATMLGLFTLLLFDAINADEPHVLNLGITAISFFPLLAGAVGSWVLITALYALPGRWAATWVALVYLAFPVLVWLLVPPATDLLVQLEHLAYRPARELHIPLVGVQWPLAPVVAALLLDRLVQRHGLPIAPLAFGNRLVRATLLCAVPLPLILPIGLLALLATTAVNENYLLAIPGAILSLLLGAIGAWGGSRLGQMTGEFLRTLEG